MLHVFGEHSHFLTLRGLGSASGRKPYSLGHTVWKDTRRWAIGCHSRGWGTLTATRLENQAVEGVTIQPPGCTLSPNAGVTIQGISSRYWFPINRLLGNPRPWLQLTSPPRRRHCGAFLVTGRSRLGGRMAKPGSAEAGPWVGRGLCCVSIKGRCAGNGWSVPCRTR